MDVGNTALVLNPCCIEPSSSLVMAPYAVSVWGVG